MISADYYFRLAFNDFLDFEIVNLFVPQINRLRSFDSVFMFDLAPDSPIEESNHL